MSDMLIELVESKKPSDKEERDHAMREALQEMILDAFSQTDFFDKAAFTGGTALRIFYRLDRFSEDLDFILKKEVPDFDLGGYLDTVRDVLLTYQIDFTVSVTDKVNDNDVKSGVVSANSRELVLSFFSNDEYAKEIYKTELTKIKIDVNTKPALHANYENRYQNNKFASPASVCDLSTMLSGKIHAILCRGWKSRVKGRDLFDFIFLVNKEVDYNFDYLKHKLVGSGFDEKDITVDNVKTLLRKKFEDLDYELAIMDAKRFVRKDLARNLKFWCPELFLQLCDRLRPRS